MAVKKITIIALAPTGSGISGSDRIFIELAREWSKDNIVEIITTTEGVAMCKRQELQGQLLTITSVAPSLPRSFFIKYAYKVWLGIKYGISAKDPDNTILYSSSDFWMDVIPAVLCKLRNHSQRWVATWYQTAPNPLHGFAEVQRERSYTKSAVLYWFSQTLIRPLIEKLADLVVVNNEAERKQFPRHSLFVMIGAVRLDQIHQYIKSHKSKKKIYDAVFQGRFHPQKGVVELIEIWRRVVDKLPEAQLVMIGDGPLLQDVKNKVTALGLEKNIILKGYVFDGEEKYEIFSRSKLVVHPAFYDSGGMAAAEAMAFGIPAVGFNLKAYNSYYPKGMVKVKKGNIDAFAIQVITLLRNDNECQKVGKEALTMIEDDWTWEKRADDLLKTIKKI